VNYFRVFVGGCGDIDDSALYQFFLQHGISLASAKVVRDPRSGKSYGYAFCDAVSQADKDALLDDLDGSVLPNGRQIKIEEPKEKNKVMQNGR
jgi:hypothetical protein